MSSTGCASPLPSAPRCTVARTEKSSCPGLLAELLSGSLAQPIVKSNTTVSFFFDLNVTGSGIWGFPMRRTGSGAGQLEPSDCTSRRTSCASTAASGTVSGCALRFWICTRMRTVRVGLFVLSVIVFGAEILTTARSSEPHTPTGRTTSGVPGSATIAVTTAAMVPGRRGSWMLPYSPMASMR